MQRGPDGTAEQGLCRRRAHGARSLILQTLAIALEVGGQPVLKVEPGKALLLAGSVAQRVLSPRDCCLCGPLALLLVEAFVAHRGFDILTLEVMRVDESFAIAAPLLILSGPLGIEALAPPRFFGLGLGAEF